MKTNLVAIMVAALIPSLSMAQTVSITNNTDKQTSADQIQEVGQVQGKLVSTNQNNANVLNGTHPPKPLFPVRSIPDQTESPTCIYENARYSEGAALPVTENGQVIYCGNRKDSQGRTVAIWRQSVQKEVTSVEEELRVKKAVLVSTLNGYSSALRMTGDKEDMEKAKTFQSYANCLENENTFTSASSEKVSQVNCLKESGALKMP